MASKPILYYTILSPPARAVLLTAAELGVDLELRNVNLLELEHRSPEFLKINPQHTVPVLSVDGVNIADSHAIVAYLSERYGKTDRLYPKDLIKRAIVDSRLHFDSSHLFSRLRFIFEPIWHGLIKELPEERVGYVRTSYDILERILADNGPYLCGDGMTIADLCCIASVSTICVLVTIDPKTHPNLTKWIERMSSLPYYEEKNAVGVKKVNEVVGELLKQNQQRQKQ